MLEGVIAHAGMAPALSDHNRAHGTPGHDLHPRVPTAAVHLSTTSNLVEEPAPGQDCWVLTIGARDQTAIAALAARPHFWVERSMMRSLAGRQSETVSASVPSIRGTHLVGIAT